MKRKSERPYVYRGVVTYSTIKGHTTYVVMKNSNNRYELLESGKTTVLMSDRNYTKVKSYLNQ